jgi:hypothetical protein
MTPEQVMAPLLDAAKVQGIMRDIAKCEQEMQSGLEMLYAEKIALALFAQAVSRPVGVNDDPQPDWDAIAQDCVKKARDTAPFLLKALGLGE